MHHPMHVLDAPARRAIEALGFDFGAHVAALTPKRLHGRRKQNPASRYSVILRKYSGWKSEREWFKQD